MTSTWLDTPVSDPMSSSPTLLGRGVRPLGRVLHDAERAQRTHELVAAAVTADASGRARLLEDVVVLNCRVADAVAARFRDRGIPLEDLQQAAYEGLVKAVHRFDPEQADDLLTFAVPTIRGEVQRHFRDRGWMVRPPRRVQELQTRVNATIASMLHELGREPTHGEIRAAAGLDEVEYAEVVAGYGCFHPISLDLQVAGDGSSTVGDLLPDEHDTRSAVEARCTLSPAVRTLGSRDQRVVYLRFFEGRTQREIGDEIGITQMQVSRLLDRILRDLRRQLVETPGSTSDVAVPA